MCHRIFTPVTARIALKTVRPAAESISRLYHALERAVPTRICSDQAVNVAYFRGLDALLVALERLRAFGVQVKDPRAGRIEFPAQRSGRSVRLCWQLDEERPRFWHEPESGDLSRHPVDEEGPWEDGEERPAPKGA